MSDAAPAAGGAPAATWRDTLPEDIRANASLATVPDVATLAKNYINQSSMIGSKRLEVPNDKWTDENWNNFYKELGRPESPDKYTMPKVEMPKELAIDDTQLQARKAIFHKIGLTDKQAAAVIEADLNWLKGGYESDSKSRAQIRTDAETALKREYGDKFDAKKGLINAVLKLGGGDLQQRIEAAGYGDDPQMFKALVALGEKLMEDPGHGGKGIEILGSEATAAAALQKIDALKAARSRDAVTDAKYNDPKSAERREWDALHAAAYNQKAA